MYIIYNWTRAGRSRQQQKVISMEKFFKYLLYYLIAFLLVLYITTIKEGMEVFGIKDYYILKSFEYFIFWVLPYWLFILILVAAVYAMITFVIVKLIKKI
ncbi:hypothetical protein AMR72_05580 [Flavobacterium psychrophilum]|nr:hypothetical protein AMR72_05580 [Flavobacterium psychrophilum]AOE52033.1 hypothetical protein ALW18_05575 [Flavobacterium psychrophilum]